MSIKDTIVGALDADGDGKVSAKEVLEAAKERVIETKDAAVEAAASVKEGFDADGDGKVSCDEVKAVGDAVTGKAADAVEGATGKLIDGMEQAYDKLP